MRLLRGLHPSMALLLIGRLMMHLLKIEPLLLIGCHLRSKISRLWTHSKMILPVFRHLLDEALNTQPALIVLNMVAWELTRCLSMH